MAFMPLDSKGALENAMVDGVYHVGRLADQDDRAAVLRALVRRARFLDPGGWVISTKNWAPKMERLSRQEPGRLVSPKHGFEFGLSTPRPPCWHGAVHV